MSTQLKIYNDALQICGERRLANLTEDRPGRYELDHVWNNGGVAHCLEQAQWKFAMRAQLLDYDPDYTNEFGYKRAFAKPSDWIITSAVCEDEYFNVPLLQYSDENGFWYAELDKIYVKFVSNASTFGADLSIWPQTFADFVSAHFASKAILKITSDKDRRAGVNEIRKEALKLAKSRDAMADPTKFPAQGSWTRSRRGGSSRDRGNRSTLIG